MKSILIYFMFIVSMLFLSYIIENKENKIRQKDNEIYALKVSLNRLQENAESQSEDLNNLRIKSEMCESVIRSN